MRLIEKLFIIAALTVSTPAHGQEYRILEQYEEAPEKGFFFSDDSFANLLAKVQAEKETALELQEMDLNFKHHLATLDFKEQIDLTNLKLEVQETKYVQILEIRKEHVERLEKLALNRRPDWVLPIAVVGTAIATAGLSVGIAYAVSDAMK